MNITKSFEYWANLAKNDPERFETERVAEIEKIISRANPEHQAQLRKLQQYIDAELAKEPNIERRMLRSFQMMTEQFKDLKRGFASIQGHWGEALEEAIDMKVRLAEIVDGLKQLKETIELLERSNQKPA